MQQRDLGAYISYENTDDATEADLTDLTFFGTDPEILGEYTEGSGTWMFLLASGTTPGVGSRILHFIEPTASSDNTEVVLPDGCGLQRVGAALGGELNREGEPDQFAQTEADQHALQDRCGAGRMDSASLR